MDAGRGLWRAIRWPVLLLVVAAVAVCVATVLDRTPAREYALVIGAPALMLLLPIGVVWFVVAVIAYAVRRRRTTRSK